MGHDEEADEFEKGEEDEDHGGGGLRLRRF
jgi:hypothetical protein